MGAIKIGGRPGDWFSPWPTIYKVGPYIVTFRYGVSLHVEQLAEARFRAISADKVRISMVTGWVVDEFGGFHIGGESIDEQDVTEEMLNLRAEWYKYRVAIGNKPERWKSPAPDLSDINYY